MIYSCSDQINSNSKISFDEATNFMKERTININQKLTHSHISNMNGENFYFYFSISLDRFGYSCISIISEDKLEIINVDCDLNDTKVTDWNNIPGITKIENSQN